MTSTKQDRTQSVNIYIGLGILVSLVFPFTAIIMANANFLRTFAENAWFYGILILLESLVGGFFGRRVGKRKSSTVIKVILIFVGGLFLSYFVYSLFIFLLYFS